MIRKLRTEELLRATPAELSALPRVPLTVVLDNLRSGNNVGSILRTADAFRLEQVVMAGITVTPPHRDILKTSLGAERTVPWQAATSASDWLRKAKSEGCRVAVLEQTTGSVALSDWRPQPNERWLLVAGNEVGGVGDELPELADVCVEVPQFGTKHSLNVAVCVGIVIWDYMTKVGLSYLSSCEVS